MEQIKLYECSDPGNAERFMDHWRDNVKYIIQEKSWFKFEDGWNNAGPLPYDLTEPVVKGIYAETAVAPSDKFKEYQEWSNLDYASVVEI